MQFKSLKKKKIFVGDLNLGRVTVSRKTLTLLDTRRKSLAEQRKLRKSNIMTYGQNKTANFNDYPHMGWGEELQDADNMLPHASEPLQQQVFSASYFNDGFESDMDNDDDDENFEMSDRSRHEQTHVTFAPSK